MFIRGWWEIGNYRQDVKKGGGMGEGQEGGLSVRE